MFEEAAFREKMAGLQRRYDEVSSMLGDPDIKISFRVFFRECNQIGTFSHRRRNSGKAMILIRHINRPITEYLAISRARCRLA